GGGGVVKEGVRMGRGGRQKKSSKVGRPLGNYEVWAQWVRDPLLSLGLRDPVERQDEIKANDPTRRAVIAVFDTWKSQYLKGAWLKASELSFEVVQLIDTKAFK